MIEQQTIDTYLAALASREATPGGGAAAGVSGAQACALMAMVCRLTHDHEDEISGILAAAESTQKRFTLLADEDMAMFKAVMDAYRMPKPSRAPALQAALRAAAEVPLAMLDAVAGCIDDMEKLARIGNPNLITDVGIASILMAATVRACRLNVLINTRSIDDETFVASAEQKIDRARDAIARLKAVDTKVDGIITGRGLEPS
ncbi:MAG TPA: cyclodeaminase/cyclohydrolase family protein [Pseudomonadales bacterium]|nr:cyclodeaminase/cyclohydrolase family protein [Pseudomonadales bacterium]